MERYEYQGKAGKEIIVRHARSSDAEDMRAEFCRVVEESKWLPILTATSRRADWIDWIHRAIHTREFLLVATILDSYVGHLSLQPEEWGASQHVAKLGIIVKQEMRGHGVGRALMLAAEEVAISNNYEKIILSTFANNVAALQLYESIGYSKVGKRLRHFKMPKGYIDEILMEKLLQ
ncbi:GNAT family N-acetyltransferase [Candidatus Thorarchaeota archaeon]|nr:MAG: GNAT family N-acetyltransferase [Candidatus Thorarchaeota archaeon]